MPKGYPKSGQRRQSGPRRLAPDSVAGRLLALLADAAQRNEPHLTCVELCRRYRQRYGANPQTSRALWMLARTGRVRQLWLHQRLRIFCLPAQGAPQVSKRHPIQLALRLVRVRWVRHGRPTTTREVTRMLRRAHATMSPRRVSAMLQQLAKPAPMAQPVRARTASRKSQASAVVWQPRLRLEETTTMVGEVQRLWYPSDVTVSRPIPATAAEGMRRVVQQSSAALGGGPITAATMRLWCAAHPDNAVSQMYAQELRVIARVPGARGDARYAGDPCRLHEVGSVYTCRGGPRVRYRLGAPTADDVLRVAVEDVASALRPAAEMASIADLRGRAERFDSSALATLADAREVATVTTAAARLRDAWADHTVCLTPERILDHIARIQMALRVLHEWEARIAATRPSALRLAQVSRLHTTRLRKELHGLAQVVRHPRFASALGQTSPQPLTVGEAALVSLEELRPYVAECNRMLGRPEVLRPRVLRNARRFPQRGSELPGDRPRRAPLDRADALLEIWQAVSMPHATVLLAEAAVVLGTVLRDRRLCQQLLEDLPQHADEIRGGVVIAVALLGELVGPEVGIPNPRDTAAVQAYILAGRLVIPEDTAFADWLDRVDERVPGRGGRDAIDLARMRIEQGSPLSVVD